MTDYFHLNAAPDTVRAISSLGLAHLAVSYTHLTLPTNSRV